MSDVKRKEKASGSFESDEHSFPVNLIGYMLQKGTPVYSTLNTVSYIFSA